VAGSGAPVLIAGGGIGGLAAGIALAREGISVHILEAAAEFSEVGAGLQIGPNGTALLQRWGLGEALRQHACRPDELLLKDGPTGGLLARIPLGDVAEARYGAPYLVMARQVLHSLLLSAARAAPDITLTCGVRVASCSVIDEHVFFGGSQGSKPLEGCGLVAADGVHSVLRRQFFSGARESPSGKTALRALIPMPSSLSENEKHAVCVWMAPNAHLVHYPIGDTGELNVVAVLSDLALPAVSDTPIKSADLQVAFRSWTRDVRDLMSSADRWTRWPLYALPPLSEWSRGPVTLVGDAAHPLQPFLASGAVMAIEDAAVLAEEVARTPTDCAAAFQRYAARRQPRLRRVQEAVRIIGEIYHMRGFMRFARNTSLAAIPRRALLALNDWLYGFKA
jgi:salicylate hydroxylase